MLFSLILLSCNKNKKVSNKAKQTSVKSILNQENVVTKSKGLLIISKSRINLGEIKKGNDIKYRFILKNVGTEIVEIMDYKISCNCTKFNLSKKNIQPSDSTFVDFIIETKDKTLGKHNIHSILTTDGQRKNYNLELNFILVNTP